MDGGGGGGDGGGGFGYGYGYGYGYLHNKPSLYRPSPPPLTAIERFLLGNNNFPYQSETQNKETLIRSSGYLGNFSSSSGAIGSCINGFSWKSTTTTHAENYNPFPEHRESCNTTTDWSYERILQVVGLNEENITNSPLREPEEVGRRTKGDSSETIIKGQWTDEEDRNLLMLVRMYGVKKWAQIAEKMVGRAGKQCRERWHNHLRPDIKKDVWSEEEERLLVETHKEVGNKWAEIAKRIPRRTENSIKNHWNATKRRQNSKRKIKKQESQNGKPKSTILQDYIKSKIMSEGSSNTVVTPTQSTTNDSTLDSDQCNLSLTDLSESSSIDDSSQLITNQSYNDELNFMINFFGNKNDPPQSNEKKPIQTEDTRMNVSALNVYLGFNRTNGDQMLTASETNMFLNNAPVEEEQLRTTDLSSDLDLSNLLDEQNRNLSMDCYYDNMKVGSQASPSSGKKEMDLMEMIASSSSSPSQFSFSNFLF